MKYIRPENIVFREEDDGAILFNADDGSVFMLEELGHALYANHLDNGATREEIIEKLKEVYPDIDANTLAKDLDEYLEQLLDAKCILKVE